MHFGPTRTFLHHSHNALPKPKNTGSPFHPILPTHRINRRQRTACTQHLLNTLPLNKAGRCPPGVYGPLVSALTKVYEYRRTIYFGKNAALEFKERDIYICMYTAATPATRCVLIMHMDEAELYSRGSLAIAREQRVREREREKAFLKAILSLRSLLCRRAHSPGTV